MCSVQLPDWSSYSKVNHPLWHLWACSGCSRRPSATTGGSSSSWGSCAGLGPSSAPANRNVEPRSSTCWTGAPCCQSSKGLGSWYSSMCHFHSCQWRGPGLSATQKWGCRPPIDQSCRRKALGRPTRERHNQLCHRKWFFSRWLYEWPNRSRTVWLAWFLSQRSECFQAWCHDG